jgi:hypothetical protein
MNTDNQTSSDILKALSREGVLINISVRYWRANKKLRAEDLGLDPDRVSDRLISLGHKRLLPREAIAQLALIESRVHAFVETNTFPFLGGIARFMPNTRLKETLERLKQFESEFDSARDTFLANYSHERESAMAEWETAARDLTDNPDMLVAAVRQSFPTRDRLAGKFAFETRLFQINAPSNITRELVSAGEQQELIDARRSAVSQAKARIHSDAETFVADCVQSMRQQTAQLCDEMLASMHNGKTAGVHQKTLNRLVRFIDQFKAMNFANDHEMEQRLEQVRREFLSSSAEDYRNSPMRDHANDLMNQDARDLVSRFGQMGKRKLMMAG